MKTVQFLVLLLLAVVLRAEQEKPKIRAVFDDALLTGLVKVKFHSSGCFHNESYELVFQKIDERVVTVAVTELVWRRMRRSDEPQFDRLPVGVALLDEKDMERLGKLLDFYENQSRKRCTTVDHLVFQKVVGTEESLLAKFEDSSCDTQGRSDILDFRVIVVRARQPGAAKSWP